MGQDIFNSKGSYVPYQGSNRARNFCLRALKKPLIRYLNELLYRLGHLGQQKSLYKKLKSFFTRRLRKYVP